MARRHQRLNLLPSRPKLGYNTSRSSKQIGQTPFHPIELKYELHRPCSRPLSGLGGRGGHALDLRANARSFEAVAAFGGSPVPSIQVDDTESSLPEDIQRHSRGSLGRGADMDSRVGWRGRMSPSSSRFRRPFEADDGAEPPAPDRPEAEGTSGASAKPQLSRSATVRATRSSGTSTASGLMIDVTDASGSR